MDNNLMIEKLKEAGISFAEGLSDEEFALAESVLNFRFPSEIRSFLACGLPVGDGFYNWRDLSATNIQRFRNFAVSIEDAFRFDIGHNNDGLRAMLEDKISRQKEAEQFSNAVLNFFHNSTQLIPFYKHRCFFGGMDNMPIVSFLQPTDTIIYGESFEDYLETEFLGKKCCARQVPERMEKTGIWYYLVE